MRTEQILPLVKPERVRNLGGTRMGGLGCVRCHRYRCEFIRFCSRSSRLNVSGTWAERGRNVGGASAGSGWVGWFGRVWRRRYELNRSCSRSSLHVGGAWTEHGRNVDGMWAEHGRNVGRLWVGWLGCAWRHMRQVKLERGRNVKGTWSELGRHMDRTCTEHG